ncbi:hypothetical protein EW145_g1093 [Phellinidium pouzarii]|uniref:Phosphatidic acid phosphatase type 2/haloperoxidase domain-containing protein n=1 Tax=Phellinidium pouzarii TaxID=167371 RepID=A0A4S4LFU7_9AGAM|nr:hypothetical protein EW145_g1093 [Phellinidium pouzarii]
MPRAYPADSGQTHVSGHSSEEPLLTHAQHYDQPNGLKDGRSRRERSLANAPYMPWFTARNKQSFAPHAAMTRRRRNALFLSYLPDWIVTIILAAAFFSLDKVPGFKREFSIDDPTLRFPFATYERVPPVALYLIAVLSPFVLQIIVNLFTVRSLWDFHNSSLGLLLSLVLTGAITQFTKITVGRPRPDVISRCQPLSGVTNPEYGLVSQAICHQPDSHIFNDGWRSFPSGHASLSFAGLGFLSFYLAGKLHLFDERGHATKAWISLTPLAGASLIIGKTSSLYFPPLNSSASEHPFSPRIARERDAEDATPILPIARPGFGDTSGSRGGVDAGQGTDTPMHPPIPHLHHAAEASIGPENAYTQYRDEGSAEDLRDAGDKTLVRTGMLRRGESEDGEMEMDGRLLKSNV